MAKIQIFRNQESINKQLARLPEVCAIIQLLLAALNSNIATFPPQAMLKFVERYLMGSVPLGFRKFQDFDAVKEITELLKNIAIDTAAEPPSIMGLKMSRSKMLEMIEIDAQAINEVSTLISSLIYEDADLFPYLRFDALGETASLEVDYIINTEDRFTVYAESAKQIEITNALLKLAVALNEYESICTNFKRPDDIDGLKYVNKVYVLDEHVIKRYL